MLDAAKENGKTLCILFFKEPDYVMSIMALLMTLDDLEGANKKHNYKVRDGESLVKYSNISSLLGCTLATSII